MSGEEVGDKRGVPGYAKPNTTSKLPASLGCEHEAIRAAFAPGSYTSISDLGKPPVPEPSDAASTHISEAAFSFKSGPMSTYFTEFEYTSSPYDLAAEIKSRERRAHHELMQDISGDKPFVPAGDAVKLKYEGVYKYEIDPFDTVKDEVLRGKWMEERKVLAGPFIPSGADRSLSKIGRGMLTDILTVIHKALVQDWEELRPTVFNTAEDLIVMYFNVEGQPKSQHGLLPYMNVMARRSHITQRYDLHKVPEGWNVTTEGTHIMFAFRPPWVKEKRFFSFAKAEDNR